MIDRHKRFARTSLAAAAFALLAATATVLPSAPAAAASSIAVVVNNQAITTGDVERRVALLRLQRDSGNLNEKAREQLVNEAIQMQEAARIGGVVGDDQVTQSVNNFASGNNLSIEQLTQVLNQAGVGMEHFRGFVRAQMTWPRVVNARYAGQGGSGGGMSQQDLVARMLERGDNKPTTTEYILQQVIFVVPAAQRNAILSQRQREAEQARARFPGCASSTEFAASLRDVSIRELGRFMQPELPPDWKTQIESTSEGGTTAIRATERGVEFIAVCQARQVSDDRAAEMVFRAEDQENETSQANSERFLEELKAKAAVSYR
ncbi:SurA N-terminal domain-containing protein [Rhizobium sp. EC-SD404]|uniref:SurA N-terminal domain-containing protein n=1 Tax=Rhizobium sp. EC-SD404 TaxID=2038389 RepID=UPI001258F9F8|nr:SurA N-terminal domain-containing protein [Rhizobium sp. EC-SD404]VVT16041.1 SurA domain-containing protein [Rhizobium sp. EC-SD404]